MKTPWRTGGPDQRHTQVGDRIGRGGAGRSLQDREGCRVVRLAEIEPRANGCRAQRRGRSPAAERRRTSASRGQRGDRGQMEEAEHFKAEIQQWSNAGAAPEGR